MYTKKNLDVRQEIERSGFCYWKVAEEMGISDAWLSKKLRRELPQDEKLKIFKAVENLKKEGRECNAV